MDRPRRWVDLTALLCLIATTSHLAVRSNTSSSFAQPQYFTTAFLLFASALCFLLARLDSNSANGLHTLGFYLEKPAGSSGLVLGASIPGRNLLPIRILLAILNNVVRFIQRVRLPPTAVFWLATLIFCRALLYSYVRSNIHCSWGWTEVLLPFAVCLVNILPRDRIYNTLPRSTQENDSPSKRWRIYHLIFNTSCILPTHAALALLWGLSTMKTATSWDYPTGIICPRGGGLEQLVPAVQLLSVGLDGGVVILLHRLRTGVADTTGDDSSSSISSWNICYSAFFTAAAALAGCLFLGILRETIVVVAQEPLDGADILTMGVDSAAAALLLVCAIYLLATFHAATVALMVVGMGVFAYRLATGVRDGVVDSGSWLGPFHQIVIFFCAGLLIKLDKDLQPSSSRSSVSGGLPHRALGICYIAVALTAVYWSSASLIARRSALSALPSLSSLMGSAQISSEQWQARAGASKSLQEAVRTYQERYGIPPPPNFDKWYEFARSKNSVIIDDFDQITSDLMPFWGVEPAVIRERTTHMLEYPRISMGGLKIHKNEVKLSPHTPGTHAWMIHGVRDMVSPFIQWLPDMDLAFNLDDECRVAVPFEDMAALLASAQKSRHRLQSTKPEGLVSTFDPQPGTTTTSTWSDGYLDEKGAQDKRVMSPFFGDYSQAPIYRNLVAPTCPPESPARTLRWWNKKETCLACIVPYSTLTSEGRVISNWTESGNTCLQPDLEHINGFIMSPATMAASKSLVPVFSQGKVSGFNDILFPSPWNYHEKTAYHEKADRPWDKKINAVFWRGSASDGFALGGNWASFLRARFVDAADAMAARLSVYDAGLIKSSGSVVMDMGRVGVNVTFVGKFPRCNYPQACRAEAETFYDNRRWVGSLGGKQQQNKESPDANEPSNIPPSVDFDEHFSYKHLVDLDGAGFSGRFIPFLQSQSIVYRAALFRTWFDERVHPWRHFVPLDLRLGLGRDAWYAMASYFGSRRGTQLGEQIALEGREWARKALRPADMEVYLFRLLLEWGRLVDDRRETLGYVLPLSAPHPKMKGS